MSATASITIQTTVNGLPEGGTDALKIELTNSSAHGSITVSTATTAVGTAPPIPIPSSGRFLIIIPTSTNTQPLRFTGTTSEVGVQVSSAGASLLSVVGGSTVHVYTTGTTAVPFRALIY